MKNYILGLLVTLFSFFATSAHAVIDVSAATNGIGDVQTALLAIIGALLAMAMAIYGINAVYNFMKRKSGTP